MAIRAAKPTYLGLFLTSLATLAYELVLTRIFSVTLWYHFSFLVVSLAMLGMTAGALVIFLYPDFFTEKETQRHMSIASLLLAITAPVAYLTHASMPILLQGGFVLSAAGLFAIALNCLILSVPFFCSGICICLALTRFPEQLPKLYAADLLGAAAACPLVAIVIAQSDGPSTLLLAAGIAALAAICLAWERPGSRELRIANMTFGALLVATGINIMEFKVAGDSFFRLPWIKGAVAIKPLYERWNSFSDVRIMGDPRHPDPPEGWGLNPAFMKDPQTGQLYEDIDGVAGTAITSFNGNLQQVDFLKYDITNIAHYLLQNAKVLVIGVGGGRDVLSALVFHQNSVLGVELNPNILNALTNAFGDFSGNLDRKPNVRLINDEARSYISRSKESFDLIQISLVDTWAATSSGAFALAENGLYTREGWSIFLQHLSDRGILSVSRWYIDKSAEIYRLLELACSALQSIGVNDPRSHLILVRYEAPARSITASVGTLLVSRSPFTLDQLAKLRKASQTCGFQIMLSPVQAKDNKLELIADAKLPASELPSQFDSTITPPTDDCPYFFQLARFPDPLKPATWPHSFFEVAEHSHGLFILLIASTVLAILTTLCVLLPLKLKSSSEEPRKALPLCAYFLGIGMGFMFIEISQMQRLSLFLGSPSYSLSVVLFAMLAFTGIGSLLASFMDQKNLLPSATARLALIIAVILIVGLITPTALTTFISANILSRILVSIAVLAPLGLAAGIAFPTGMRMAQSKAAALTPWLWGINGAASILSSVVAVFVAVSFGINFSFYLACVCYAIAACAASLYERRTHM